MEWKWMWEKNEGNENLKVTVPYTNYDQTPRQLKILPPTRKYLATIHPAKPHTYILPPYMFPWSTEWTGFSVPQSTHPPATRSCLSWSRPTHNNAPAYCKSSSPGSELHTPEIFVVLLLAIIKICKIKKCYGVRDLGIKLIEIAYCISLAALVCTTWWWPPCWPKHVVDASYPPSLAVNTKYSCV